MMSNSIFSSSSGMELKQQSSISTFHPLAVIPEEEQSICSDYSAPSDCECFKLSPKLNEDLLMSQKNGCKEIIQRKGSIPFLTDNKKHSSTKRPTRERSEDNIFAWRLKSTREKLEATLLNIFLSISNIPEPDGIQDMRRRRQRDIEFTSRFCRNYLYQFHRQILVLQHRLKEKSYCGLQHVYKTSMSQKLLNAHHLAHLALQAVLNHIPTTLLMNIPKKLKEFLVLVLELSEITTKSGVVREDTDNEIEKCCRDILSVLPDADTKDCNTYLYAFSENTNRNYDLIPLKKHEPFPEINRFSMYATNVCPKRRETFLRSSQCAKKSRSTAQGKESAMSSKNDICSYNRKLISAVNENSSTRTRVLSNAMRNKDESKEMLGKRTEKKQRQMHISFNMDNVETMMESISSDKSEEDDNRCQQFERLSSNTHKISSHTGKEIAIITSGKKQNQDITVQSNSETAHSMKRVDNPQLEELVRDNREEIGGDTNIKTNVNSKYTGYTGGNLVTETEIIEEEYKDKQIFPKKNNSQISDTNLYNETSLPPQNRSSRKADNIKPTIQPLFEEPVRDSKEGIRDEAHCKANVYSKNDECGGRNLMTDTQVTQKQHKLKEEPTYSTRNTSQLSVTNLCEKTSLQITDRSNRAACNVKLIILPPYEESVRSFGGGLQTENHSKATVNSKYEDCARNNPMSDLELAQEQYQIKNDLTYPTKNTSQLSVVNLHEETDFPSQNRVEALHLENIVTFRDQGKSNIKEITINPINNIYSTKELTGAYQNLHMESDEKIGPLWLQKTIAIEKNCSTQSQTEGAVFYDTKLLLNDDVSDTQNAIEQEEKECMLYDAEKEIDVKVSPVPKMLKVNTSQLESVLEYKKRYQQYLSSNPMYMKSAKPWLIVSSLADTLIYEMLHEIIEEFDLDTIITQMLHMELQ